MTKARSSSPPSAMRQRASKRSAVPGDLSQAGGSSGTPARQQTDGQTILRAVDFLANNTRASGFGQAALQPGVPGHPTVPRSPVRARGQTRRAGRPALTSHGAAPRRPRPGDRRQTLRPPRQAREARVPSCSTCRIGAGSRGLRPSPVEASSASEPVSTWASTAVGWLLFPPHPSRSREAPDSSLQRSLRRPRSDPLASFEEGAGHHGDRHQASCPSPCHSSVAPLQRDRNSEQTSRCRHLDEGNDIPWETALSPQVRARDPPGHRATSSISL
jgi:hypothetical protein